jgi:hypothetical protein
VFEKGDTFWTYHPSIKGKESCKKWQRSFFYVKDLKKGTYHVNLPPFDANGPARDNWSVPLPHPSPDMEKILQRISTMQTEGDLEPADLLLAFVVACLSPLQRRSHKMCFLGSAKDSTRHSSRILSALEVVRKVNRIADVKLPASWEWGLEPHDRANLIAEVNLPDLTLVIPPLQFRSPDLCLLGLGRICSPCKLWRILPNDEPALPPTERSQTKRSSRTRLRRWRMLAPRAPSRARVPLKVMKEMMSSQTRANPSTTPVSSPVLLS